VVRGSDRVYDPRSNHQMSLSRRSCFHGELARLATTLSLNLQIPRELRRRRPLSAPSRRPTAKVFQDGSVSAGK